MAATFTIRGKITQIVNKSDANLTANVSYRKVNIQPEGFNPADQGGLIAVETFDATNASGIDALFVGSSCTMTVTSP